MKNKDKFKDQELTRRSFVKQTALATSGLLSVPLSVEAMANVNGEKKLKLALIGCGGRGSGAAVQALTADENVELVAMADAFADRIEKSLRGIQKHFEGEEKLDYSTSTHKGSKRKFQLKKKISSLDLMPTKKLLT